jgi:hypothetical protein
MRAIRKKLVQSRGSILTWLAGALALTTPNASAQSLPPINLLQLQLQQQQKHLTPEEQEQQKKLDDAYKAGTKKIPEAKANDPWADVRQTPTVLPPKKKQN